MVVRPLEFIYELSIFIVYKGAVSGVKFKR